MTACRGFLVRCLQICELKRDRHRIYVMNKSNGFTLVELMVVIAIVAILLTLGVPAMNQFIASSRVVTASNDMVYIVTLGRSEAVKRRSDNVVLAKKGAGSADDWSGGAVLFLDKNDNHIFDGVSTDEKIQEIPALKSGFSLKVSESSNSSGAAVDNRYMKFSKLGIILTGQKMTFDVCENNDVIDISRERVISIGLSGRPSVKSASDVSRSPAPCS